MGIVSGNADFREKKRISGFFWPFSENFLAFQRNFFLAQAKIRTRLNNLTLQTASKCLLKCLKSFSVKGFNLLSPQAGCCPGHRPGFRGFFF
jgi:hypothetical protein